MRNIRNDTKNEKAYSEKVIYPELSYELTGILFEAKKELGPYAKEKQYGDFIERRLKESLIPYKREYLIVNSGNILDFLVDNKIVLEIKATRLITKESYRQTQNYLQQTMLKLGILVNFREKFMKPIRVVRID